MPFIPPGLHAVRTLYVNCHVLVDRSGRAAIIDSGFAGSRRKFRRMFERTGLSPDCVDALILTHGHLDHSANLHWLKELTGAPVFAHALEAKHLTGTWPYRGVARVCGVMEAIGRRMVSYQPVPIDQTFTDGDVLPFWDGLRVIHLPGHSAGHCGFWSEKFRLLFIGDLAAVWTWRTTFPPPIFNSQPELLPDSLRRAADLKPDRVVPNHYDRFDPELLARRFLRFAARKLGR